MELIVKNLDVLKRKVTLIPENSFDLLSIFRLINVDDVIYSETSREIKKERADGRYDSERVVVEIGVRVEKKTADPLLKRIGFTGRIVYESKQLDLLGKYHTIHVSPGRELEVESRERFDKLYSFAQSYLKKKRIEKLVCIAVDNENIALTEFSNKGLKTIYSKTFTPISRNLEEKYSSEESLYEKLEEIKTLLNNVLKNDEKVKITILGPSIYVERVTEYFRKNAKNLFENIVKRGYTSQGGEMGIMEALRRGELREYSEELKPIKDSIEVEEFIEKMSSNPEKVALSLREVVEAWRMKAVEKVLVSEKYLWENIVNEELSQLLDEAERGRLDLRVILDGLEASEKILGLGGIVATLYYPLKLSERKTK
ncbi:MAG: hypothetical protein QXP74_00880 [Nitrososphaerota archaeon]